MPRIPNPFRKKGITVSPGALAAIQQLPVGSSFFGFPRNAYINGFYYDVQSMRLSALWQSQPSVESVVGYLVRQYQQVPIVLKELDVLTGAVGEQDYTHPVAQTIRNPGIDYGDVAWRMRMAMDYYIYRNAYSIIVKPPGSDTAVLQHIPAYAMGVFGSNKLLITAYQVIFADGSAKQFDPNEVIHWRGPNSQDPKIGWSQLEQVRDVLTDEAVMRAANIEFNRSGRVKGGVVERPVEAPELNNAGRERMGKSYADEMKRLNEGGVLVIDEGGKWVDVAATAKESEAIAEAAANFATICMVYGLNPNLLRGLGQDQIAARDSLFMDILPGDTALLLEAINRTLVQGVFSAFDRVAVMDWSVKLEGQEEKYQKLVGAAGGPILTRNEARKKAGEPPLDDPEADKLLLAPGYAVEGAAPSVPVKPTTNVMPVPDPNGPAQDGSHRDGDPPAAKTATEAEFDRSQKAAENAELLRIERVQMESERRRALDAKFDSEVENDTKAASEEEFEASRRAAEMAAERQEILRIKSATSEDAMRRRRGAYADQIAAVLRSHLARQQRAFGSRKALRADTARYDSELASDLLKVYTAILIQEGDTQSARLLGTFDPGHVEHWAADGAKAFAEGFNATTQKHLDEAVAGKSLGDDPTDDIAHVFEVASTSRVNEASATAATRLLAFASLAAAQQLDEPGIVRLKYWVPSSAEGRHAGLANIGIPLKQAFENGQQYPGDPAGGSDQCAGCQCLLRII